MQENEKEEVKIIIYAPNNNFMHKILLLQFFSSPLDFRRIKPFTKYLCFVEWQLSQFERNKKNIFTTIFLWFHEKQRSKFFMLLWCAMEETLLRGNFMLFVAICNKEEEEEFCLMIT